MICCMCMHLCVGAVRVCWSLWMTDDNKSTKWQKEIWYSPSRPRWLIKCTFVKLRLRQLLLPFPFSLPHDTASCSCSFSSCCAYPLPHSWTTCSSTWKQFRRQLPKCHVRAVNVKGMWQLIVASALWHMLHTSRHCCTAQDFCVCT